MHEGIGVKAELQNMHMDLFAFAGGRDLGARFQKEGEGVGIRLDPGKEHADVEGDGENWRWAQRVAPDDGVPDYGVGFVDGVEDEEGVGEVAEGGDGAELNELAQRELGVVEASFDEVGMCLFDGLGASASGEERKRWMVLEVFVWRV